jgi:hypothetical protein
MGPPKLRESGIADTDEYENALDSLFRPELTF